MEVSVESGRLRTGRLAQEEWPLLGQGIDTLGERRCTSTTSPIPVLEMRSLCRRLNGASRSWG